jgi:hypothetical protein
VLHLVHRLALPAPGGEPGGAVPGRELRPALNGAAFNWLTTLGRAAARRFNEVPSDTTTAGG